MDCEKQRAAKTDFVGCLFILTFAPLLQVGAGALAVSAVQPGGGRVGHVRQPPLALELLRGAASAAGDAASPMHPWRRAEHGQPVSGVGTALRASGPSSMRHGRVGLTARCVIPAGGLCCGLRCYSSSRIAYRRTRSFGFCCRRLSSSCRTAGRALPSCGPDDRRVARQAHGAGGGP